MKIIKRNLFKFIVLTEKLHFYKLDKVILERKNT